MVFMKREEAALRTRQRLADQLKELLRQKSLSKITVSELVDCCHINRKTFYNYFQDIFDLLQWTLEQEAINVVKQFHLIADYEDAIRFVMDYVEENERILTNIYSSAGQEVLKRFFAQDFIGIGRQVIDEVVLRNGLTVSDSFRDFYARFLACAVAGILVEWIRTPSRRKRENTLRNISTILRTAIPTVLAAAAREEQENGVPVDDCNSPAEVLS